MSRRGCGIQIVSMSVFSFCDSVYVHFQLFPYSAQKIEHLNAQRGTLMAMHGGPARVPFAHINKGFPSSFEPSRFPTLTSQEFLLQYSAVSSDGTIEPTTDARKRNSGKISQHHLQSFFRPLIWQFAKALFPSLGRSVGRAAVRSH